jgi:hypothetical protein
MRRLRQMRWRMPRVRWPRVRRRLQNRRMRVPCRVRRLQRMRMAWLRLRRLRRGVVSVLGWMQALVLSLVSAP